MPRPTAWDQIASQVSDLSPERVRWVFHYAAIVEYIVQQESHHRVVSFQDEFRKLLETHGIAYDERYVWD